MISESLASLVLAASAYVEAVESDSAKEDDGIALQVTYRDLRSAVDALASEGRTGRSS